MTNSAARCDGVDQGIDAVESDWVRAHHELSRLARQRALADAEEGRWLLAALRSAAHLHLGFGSFSEYVGRLFGYGQRSIEEKLRVAAALEELPVLAGALESGALTWSAARELTRVAVAETEREWLDVASGKTVRQIEELVAGAHAGDHPSSPRKPEARRRVLRFEVAPETFALFRDAVSELRRRSDARLDDDALLLTLARVVLGGPRDEGRSSYQVSLMVCSECGGAGQLGGGELVAVGPEVVELAQCDGQALSPMAQATNDNAASSDVDSSQPEPAEASHAGAHVGADVDVPKALENGRTTASSVGSNIGATQAVARTHFPRAKQTIPPAVRRAVLARDQRCCRVPGCRNATFLDLHHLRPRADGGRNEAANLVTLCGAHHRAIHRGELALRGSAADGVSFLHADGARYGMPASAREVEVHCKVLAALCHLGFREARARAVLSDLIRREETAPATSEMLLREALARLTPDCIEP